MEEVRGFGGGMHLDFDEQNQPKDTYRTAYNWVRRLDGSMNSEKGTTLIQGLPNKPILHSYVLEGVIVLFFHSPTLAYEIGYLDGMWYKSVIVNTSLNFSPTSLIKCRGRVDYRGHRIVYFVDGRNDNRYVDLDRDYSKVIDISNALKLQLDTALPEVNVLGVGDDGSLPTGIYQFQVRLLTSSTNYSIPSLMTNPTPIVNEVGNSQVMDGAPPQTPSFKSITIGVSNIDRKFKFVEVIAITYTGVTNTPRAYIIGRKLISSDSTTFTYRSTSQNLEEITLDELTIDPVIYSSGRFIEYKDGHLLIAGPRGKKEGSAFQKVANAAIVKYVIKEVNYSETVSIDGLGTGEVLDKGSATHTDGYHNELFNVYYKGWQRDEVYDIGIVPEYTNGTIGSAYHIPAPSLVGPANTTTKRLGSYVSSESYPQGFGYPTGKIRLHVMPNNMQEPMVSPGKVRILGIKVEVDLNVLTAEEKKDIKGWIVVRQRRTEGNRRVLAQGIAQPHVKTGEDQDLLMVSPFTGKHHYLFGYNPSNDTLNWNKYLQDHVAFYSPDTILGGELPMADRLTRVGWTEGTAYLVGLKETNNTDPKDLFAHLFIDYSKYNFPSMTAMHTEIDKSTVRVIPSQSTNPLVTVDGVTERISTIGNNGYLFFKTKSTPQYTVTAGVDDYPLGSEIMYSDKGESEDDDIIMYRNGKYDTHNHPDINFRGESKRVIYNLTSTSKSLYGDLSQAEYIYVGKGSGELYNGDTFINKMAIVSATSRVKGDGEINAMQYRTLSYIFLESRVNAAYRHSVTTDGENAGTVPYFPKRKNLFSVEKQDGVMQVDPSLGHAVGYNKQYSFDNGLKKFYPKPILLEEEVSDFPNRVIVSEVALEGEQYDANRVFLPNSYHDIPKHKGTVTDMFLHNNTLYFHTPQTLWRSFFNESTMASTSSGDVVLGNGGIFSRPSMEVFTLQGGYAGTCNSGGINTPFGRVFVDELQGKVFMLGESFDEISMGMSKYFAENIVKESDTLTSGYTAAYDYLNRRVILTRRGKWTLSYSPELKSWTSSHNYYPDHMLSNGNRTYIYKGSMYELGKGKDCEYMGRQYSNTIDIVFNDSPITTKVFDNLFINSTDTFTSMEVRGEDSEKGYTPILLENDDYMYDDSIVCKYRNSQYQLPVPRDKDDSRFRGKWVEVKLTKDLPKDYSVKYITMLFRVNRR